MPAWVNTLVAVVNTLFERVGVQDAFAKQPIEIPEDAEYLGHSLCEYGKQQYALLMVHTRY